MPAAWLDRAEPARQLWIAPFSRHHSLTSAGKTRITDPLKISNHKAHDDGFSRRHAGAANVDIVGDYRGVILIRTGLPDAIWKTSALPSCMFCSSTTTTSRSRCSDANTA